MFEIFKKWKVMVNAQLGLKLKYLIYDNEKEYIDGGFKKYVPPMVLG
jgi:hypothetical protein